MRLLPTAKGAARAAATATSGSARVRAANEPAGAGGAAGAARRCAQAPAGARASTQADKRKKLARIKISEARKFDSKPAALPAKTGGQRIGPRPKNSKTGRRSPEGPRAAALVLRPSSATAEPGDEASGQVSWLALPGGPPSHCQLIVSFQQWLRGPPRCGAYSCGDSSGLGTGFPFKPFFCCQKQGTLTGQRYGVLAAKRRFASPAGQITHE